MRASVEKFYRYLKGQPCLRCGSRGVEVAHIRGFVSLKTGDFLPRRQGIAALSAIPLCTDCHRIAPDSIHHIGEAAFFEALGKPVGWVYAYLARSIAEALA